VGGVEAYLGRVVPLLARAGHDLALVAEVTGPADREPIVDGDQIPAWTADGDGREAMIARVRQWRPDAVYAHGFLDPALDAACTGLAPTVQFLHTYYGTCISGAKTFTVPAIRPCDRRFGPGCLVRYYPRRTGGLNPVTMAREYRRQQRRLDALRSSRLLLTHSDHMRHEYLRHGFPADRVRKIRWYVPSPNADDGTESPGTRHDLLFVGRMDRLKGGTVLLDALGSVTTTATPLYVTFVGDGPDRAAWERRAAALRLRHPGLTITFAGWLTGQALEERYRRARLLVVPSLWPEPFGQVGLEAAQHGVPAVAFDVGGIAEWLRDGITGTLVAELASPAALARAINALLTDPERCAALSRGAKAHATQFSAANHLSDLERALNDALGLAPTG